MNPLLIFGASTRAAAFSAIRAGFDPICGDMFADADLRAHATRMLDIPDYPVHLTDVVRHLPDGTPWIYTGALENSPAEVDRVCRRHRLWGNSGDTLRRCRDPWQCAMALQQAGLPTLELRSADNVPERDGAWMVKPFRSAGGRAISIWQTNSSIPEEAHYFQRRAEGAAISAAYLAGGGWTKLLGVSRQFIGVPELHAPAFAYCGSSFSPDDFVDLAAERRLRDVGEVIGCAFGLRGLFGIDFVDDGRTAWMTEVNPRYTASMELIEHAYQQPLLDWHRRACEGLIGAADVTEWRSPSSGCYAKAILYANRQTWTPELARLIPRTISLDQLPGLADIPVTGTEILAGQPVFTCLGQGKNAGSLWTQLVDRAHGLWAGFAPSTI